MKAVFIEIFLVSAGSIFIQSFKRNFLLFNNQSRRIFNPAGLYVVGGLNCLVNIRYLSTMDDPDDRLYRHPGNRF